jgi:hypothetical protein
MEMEQEPAERKLAGGKRTRSQAWPSDSMVLVPQPQPEDTGVAPTTTLAVNEIFCRVRGYCLTREDKANLSCTNKAIRAAARNTTRSLDFSVNNTYRHRGITSAQLAEFIPRYAHAHIDHVNLSGCTQITDTGLQALAQHCSGLTSLNLGGAPYHRRRRASLDSAMRGANEFEFRVVPTHHRRRRASLGSALHGINGVKFRLL